MKISNKVAGIGNPLEMLRLKSRDIEDGESQMNVLKPQEIEIDIGRFKAIPELKDGHDSDDDETAVKERDEGYNFIMNEINKVYEDDITTNNNKFVSSRKEKINDDVVQTV